MAHRGSILIGIALFLVTCSSLYLLDDMFFSVPEPCGHPSSFENDASFLLDSALAGAHLAAELEQSASTEQLRAMGLSMPPALLAGGSIGLGALLLRALLVGLSSWMPSSVLGDAAQAGWGMRRALDDELFRRWLKEALAWEDTPRIGMSAEQKAQGLDCLCGHSLELPYMHS